jgi:hypothetical protein
VASDANIEKALRGLIGDEPLLTIMASVLEACRRQQGLTFGEAAGIAGNMAPEVLLLAWDWRLLLPRRSRQCAEWDDRVMRFEADEYYEMPNIVRFLLDIAARNGLWDPASAVDALYVHMGEPEHEKMPALVREIVKSAVHFQINGAAIGVACVKTGLGKRTGAMIALLKGGGLISPRLLGTAPMEKVRSPVYEVHPAVRWP